MIDEILIKNYKNKYIFAIYDESKSFHSNATFSICSKPSCVLKEEDVLERVDTIYCWFHNFRYYGDLLEKVGGKSFFKALNLINLFHAQNSNHRFKAIGAAAIGFGWEGLITSVAIFYDSINDSYIYTKLNEEDMYHIYSFDKNILNNKSIEDLIHYGIEDKLIISNGNINDVSDDVKTNYQAVITFNKFLIANHYIINDYNYFEITDFKPIKSSSKCI